MTVEEARQLAPGDTLYSALGVALQDGRPCRWTVVSVKTAPLRLHIQSGLHHLFLTGPDLAHLELDEERALGRIRARQAELAAWKRRA